MKKRSVKFFLLGVVICLTGTASKGVTQNKQIVGWLEKVRIYPENLLVRAKLDTGAKNSSLNAPHVSTFERRGETWVRFDIEDRNGKTATLERKLQRTVKIRQHDRTSALRPVVHLSICLGGAFKVVEVNLEDRSDFNYQMLVGRSFLKEDFVVDPSMKFTTKPKCHRAKIP
jgi:hypothetical protein